MQEPDTTADDDEGLWKRFFFASILVMFSVMVDIAAFNPQGIVRTVAYVLVAVSFGACFFAAFMLRVTQRFGATSDGRLLLGTSTDNDDTSDFDSCDEDSSGSDSGGCD